MIVPKRAAETKPQRARQPRAFAKGAHAELCERARTWLLGAARCQIAFVELKTDLQEIPDAIGFRAGGRESILVECKTSRADFLADRKKRSRQSAARETLGTFRYFLCEAGIIRPEDLPERWGLLIAGPRGISVAAGLNPRRYYAANDADVAQWRWPRTTADHVVLYSALRRLQIELGAKQFREMSQKTVVDRNEEREANHWSLVLGCARDASTSDIRAAMETAVVAARPENGGTAGQLQRVATAWQQVCIEHGIAE